MATSDKVLEKVGDLVRLANSKSDDEDEDGKEERRTAAMQATRLMKEHELVLVPKAEIDRVKKMIGDANALAKKYEGEAQQKMLLGALGGFLLAKQGMF